MIIYTLYLTIPAEFIIPNLDLLFTVMRIYFILSLAYGMEYILRHKRDGRGWLDRHELAMAIGGISMIGTESTGFKVCAWHGHNSWYFVPYSVNTHIRRTRQLHNRFNALRCGENWWKTTVEDFGTEETHMITARNAWMGSKQEMLGSFGMVAQPRN